MSGPGGPGRGPADDALPESETHFRAIADTAPVLLWTRDATGAADFINRACLDFLGGTRETVLAGGWAEAVHPDDRARVIARSSEFFASPAHEPYQIEYRVRGHGAFRWVLARMVPRFAPDGAFAGMVGTAFDLTERREAEEALRESEARFRALADAAPVHIWTVDADAECTFINRAWLDFTGRPIEHELGSGWTESVHPDDREALRAVYARNIARRQPFEFEYRARRHDGEYRDLIAWESPWHAADGTFLGFIGAGMDVTERKRGEARLLQFKAELERRIDERTAELEATNRALELATRHKSEFLSSMSHELRTPLNVITGFAELIHDGKAGPVTPEQVEYLEDLLNSAGQVLRLVDHVLDLAKVEAGQLQLTPESVDVAAVVESVRDALRPQAEKQGVAVAAYVDAALGRVVVDPQRLTQVLLNYCSNALKHTTTGDHVEIRARSEGADRFRVEVEDTGSGIHADDLPRLFRDFEQLRVTGERAPPGAGLGLALTRRIVEAQGGEVGVRSQLGRGSVFWAVLPRGR